MANSFSLTHTVVCNGETNTQTTSLTAPEAVYALDIPIAGSTTVTTNFDADKDFDAYWMKCTGALTVVSGSDTITLAANKPVTYLSGAGAANLFTGDITSLSLQNAGTGACTFTFRGGDVSVSS